MAVSKEISQTGLSAGTNTGQNIGTGSARVVILAVFDDTANNAPTVAGTSATLIDSHSASGLRVSLWYVLPGGTSGNQTIVIPSGAADGGAYMVLDGVDQITVFDSSSNTGGSNTFGFANNVNLPSVTNSNCWMIAAYSSGVNLNAGFSGDFVGGSSGGPSANKIIISSDATIGTGSQTGGVFPQTTSGTWSAAVAAFMPATRFPFTVTDSTAVTDTIEIQTALSFRVTDTTAVSDNPIVGRLNIPSNFDTLTSLVVSGYKWLTSTLFSAQNAAAVRPYFRVQILDDTISSPTVLQEYTPTVNKPSYASSIVGPDGVLLMAGYGNDSKGTGISFWRVTDPTVSDWSSYETNLVDSSTTIAPVSNWCSISCSDYINGSYHIDIYYTYNSSGVAIGHWYSDDGGITWTAGYTTTAPGIPYSDFQNNVVNYCLVAGKPVMQSTGQILSSFFYLKKNSNSFSEIPSDSYMGYDVWYQRRTAGSSFNSPTMWSQKNINSQDWTIHSFDVQSWTDPNTNQTIDLLIFSGLHNLFESVNTTLPQSKANYGIFLGAARVLTDTQSTDLWDEAVEILTTNSGSTINFDSFILPRMSFDGTTLFLLFHSTTVDSISTTSQGSQPQVVTETTGYYLMTSQDGKNFSYPTLLADTSGNLFNDSYTIGTPSDFVYMPTNSSYWTCSSTANGSAPTVWKFTRNNFLADVTNDILSYEIDETAGSPSSITNLSINNANNQWYPNGTKTNASAIAKNKKILIDQGYYNSAGNPESVPRNIYFIDDITQNVSSTTNDLVLMARDLYKNLKVTISRFAFTFFGPTFYSDIFDGTTIGNWNQISGGWNETSNTMTLTSQSSGDNVIVSSGIFQIHPSAQTSCVVTISSIPNVPSYVYGSYIDSNNWVRLSIENDGSGNIIWAVQVCYGGTIVTYDTGTRRGASFSNGMNFTFLIKRYDWYKFSFMMSSNNGLLSPSIIDPSGNSEFAWNYGNNYGTQPILFNSSTGGSTNGEFDATQYFNGTTGNIPGLGTVGFGCNGFNGSFSYFKFSEFTNSQDINELEKNLGTKSGIFSYNLQKNFSEYFFNISRNYYGSFTLNNRFLKIAPSNLVINNITSEQISNGTLEFDLKMNPSSSASRYGFSLIFRNTDSSDTNNGYLWNNYVVNGGTFTGSRFLSNTNQISYSGQFLLNSSSLQYELSNSNGSPVYLNDLNIDLTQWHHYKIVMSDGWMYGFVDGQMVVSWQDNNTTQPWIQTGYWGFQTESNSTVYIKNITSPTFWNQIPSFSINPGDDMESAIESIEALSYGYHFSDLMGRFKNILTESTDTSTYTYQNALIVQQTDLSDKEYYNQVKVYGTNNITATARDATSIASTGKVREYVVQDYKITTYQDAQTRANQELSASKKYNSQYTPQSPMNVGSELFDVITIVNTGNNSSGVNGTTRVYNQTMQLGGNSSNNYQLTIDTGGNN